MHEIKISQLGEGLTEVRIVTLHKKVGDWIEKDECLLEVETDKAVMDIESPWPGRLQEWLVQEGGTASVGSTIALIEETPEAQQAVEPAVNPAPVPKPHFSSRARNGATSPRERARQRHTHTITGPDEMDFGFSKHLLSPHQTRIKELFSHSAPFISETSLTMRVRWDILSAACRQLKSLQGLEYRPTPPEMIAWCVVQAMNRHEKFRVINLAEKGYVTQAEVCLGNAVALSSDDLTIAYVHDAALMKLADFISAMRLSLEGAITGGVFPGRPQVIISYMAQHDVWHATSRILLPSVAALFVGTPFEIPIRGKDDSLDWQRLSNLVLTFDHHIINGAGAAAFLRDIRDTIESLPESYSPEPDGSS